MKLGFPKISGLWAREATPSPPPVPARVESAEAQVDPADRISFFDFIAAAQKVPKNVPLHVQDDMVVTWADRIGGVQPEEAHRKTREVFHRTVQEFMSPSRISHLHYRYGYDLETMSQSIYPLLPGEVEKVGTLTGTAYAYNIREALNKSEDGEKIPLTQLSVDEVRFLNAKVTNKAYLGSPLDPHEVKGGPALDHENLTIDYEYTDKRRKMLFSNVERLLSDIPEVPQRHPYYSRLSMAIISLLETEEKNSDIHLVIPAPGARPGEVDYYRIHRIVAKGGLTAVGLVPISGESSLPPIISFRCTEQAFHYTNAPESMKNDMERNIGESGYLAAKEALDELMNDLTFTRGQKVSALGYSLGGGHLTYFVRDHWEQLQEVIMFNGTGTEASVVEDTAKAINALPENCVPPPIYLHRNVSTEDGSLGDWVNKSGEKHLGWGITHPNAIVQVIEWVIDTKPVVSEDIHDISEWQSWFDLHSVRPMDEGKLCRKYRFNIYRGPTECNRLLDTYYRDRALEDKRRYWGSNVAMTLFSYFYQVFDFIFRLLGIGFFRRNI